MVGIICFWDRYATPYLQKYENLLISSHVDYEIIFWNRAPKIKKREITQIGKEITIHLESNGSKIKKMSAFLMWKSMVSKVLRRRKYSQLIVLSTVPAVLLFPYLVGKYKDRYIFDIRDYTLESNPVFKKIVDKIIDCSIITPISSKGFFRWLSPSPKIIVNHNITVRGTQTEPVAFSSNKEKINFGFVGNVRLDLQTKELLLKIGKHERIEQHFYGRVLPSCDITDIAKENHILNLYLHGPFDVKQKPEIYQNIDLINCVYANAEKEADIPLGDSTPLPNRLYDCLAFYRPIAASKGTYLAELVDEYHLGISINGFDDEAPDKILEYADSFESSHFVQGCDMLREEVEKEEAVFTATIQKIFCNWAKGGDRQ